MEKKEFHYHEITSTNPYYNLAMEECLLKNKEENFILIWRNDKSVIVGVNQILENEVVLPYAMKKGIRVIRRSTGGGAVFHDLGNINYSIITNYNGMIINSLDLYVRPIIEALRYLGLKAMLQGKNDIMVNGKKVSGCAQKIDRNRMLHHGCILFDVDLDTMSKVLRTNNSKANKNIPYNTNNHVENISSLLNTDMSRQEFMSILKSAFLSAYPAYDFQPTKWDVNNFNMLMNRKYINSDWIYGYPIFYNYHVCHRFEEGFVDVYLNVADGIIEDIHIYGNFMARRPITDITLALKGCCFNKDKISEVLMFYESKEYFGNIDKRLIISMICTAGKEKL